MDVILGTYRLGQVGLSPDRIDGYTNEEFTHMNVAVAVLSGTVEIRIGDETEVCHRGDTYFVPGGVPHVTLVRAGTRGLDVFEEHDRYRPLPDGQGGASSD